MWFAVHENWDPYSIPKIFTNSQYLEKVACMLSIIKEDWSKEEAITPGFPPSGLHLPIKFWLLATMSPYSSISHNLLCSTPPKFHWNQPRRWRDETWWQRTTSVHTGTGAYCAGTHNNSAIPSGNGTKNTKYGVNYCIQLGYSAVHLVDYYIDLSKKNSSVSVALLTGCHDFQDP